MKDLFKKYLDNSADCDTMYLELADKVKEFRDDYIWLEGWDASVTTDNELLFNLIRTVWDKAYSHGYHDAQAECNLTLEEIEE